MNNMVEQLIAVLKRIENNADIQDYEHDVIPTGNSEVQEASTLADSILISARGGVDWDNIEILREHGYSVFPLERDRFGWLIGGISTKKGTISFG